MKKIGHESIDSYKMLKFNTFSFFTLRKFFSIMLHMLLILFRFAMCYICYKVYSVRHCSADFIMYMYFPTALYVHGNLMFMSFNY